MSERRDLLADLDLWQVLQANGTDAQRQMVRSLVEHAAPVLDRIVETLPTYTLHQSTHSKNIVRLITKLLGDRIAELSSLEAALLIISAFWHDIGMYFGDQERKNLICEARWREFLENNPRAYIAVSGDRKAEPPLEIAELYCRWTHAERVFVHIRKARQQGHSFKWGVYDLSEELGHLCFSHNLNIKDVISKLSSLIEFRGGEADILFCSILLRLADILDFDRSRSPESVYKYLGIERRSDPRQVASDVEWQKHLASEGFKFPSDRYRGYALDFVAGPNHPAVQHDLLEFLDQIEMEFAQCRSALRHCSERWQEFLLPGRISRDGIHPNGYRYGEYRFHLDKDKILQLFMGDFLYSSQEVFLRELLQNAIDATRLRAYFAYLRSGQKPSDLLISVSEWTDKENNHWIRIDDFGVGMDEKIVRDFMLRVGRSYYSSSEFEADKLRLAQCLTSDFVPISRFGVGLLSCFLVGDRVEISTKRELPDGGESEPVRLSLNGVKEFYTVQTPHLEATQMPTAGTEPEGRDGYRRLCGTSIAIRIDSRRETKPLHVKKILCELLLGSSVKVNLDGEEIGFNDRFLDFAFCDEDLLTLDLHELSIIGERLGFRLSSDDLKAVIAPLDLTSHTFDRRIRGQFLAVSLKFSDALRHRVEHERLKRRGAGHSFPKINLKVEGGRIEIGVDSDYVVAREINVSSTCHEDLLKQLAKAANRLAVPTWIEASHNGIRLPSTNVGGWQLAQKASGKFRGFQSPLEGNDLVIGGQHTVFLGILALKDGLRPEVSLARDAVREFGWEIRYKTDISIKRALTAVGVPLEDQAEFKPTLFQGEEIRKNLDWFLTKKSEEEYEKILREPIFKVSNHFFNFYDTLNLVSEGNVELRFEVADLNPLTALAAGLAHLEFDMKLVEASSRVVSLRVLARRSIPIQSGEKLFPPLSFVKLDEGNHLRYGEVWNREHPFSAWLLIFADKIADQFPGIFNVLRQIVTASWADSRSAVNELNHAIDRLAMLEQSLMPSQIEHVSKDDFVGAWRG